MPLRDHFRPPLSDQRPWDGFHGQWPAMIVVSLNRQLPRRYVAEPLVHLGSSIEIDVAAYDDAAADSGPDGPTETGAGVATVVWSPPKPSMAVAAELPGSDSYEVYIHDTRSGRRLVAAIEIVSPANKDRPEHRRAFVAKCASLIHKRVCVAIVDVVTTRTRNLYGELMELLGQPDTFVTDGPPFLYAAVCRWTSRGEAGFFETWTHSLTLGQPLPTLPLWLAESLAIPLDLEASYEETCRALRID